MKFKQFLLEMPIIDNSAGSYGNQENYWSSKVYDQTKNSKVFSEKEIDNYIYKSAIGSFKKTLDVIVYDKDKIIGFLSTTKIFNSKIAPKSYPKIGWVAVKPNCRNKNIAKNMYDIAINYYGGILSDDLMTENAFNFWKTFLSKKYYCYVAKFGAFDSHLKILGKFNENDYYKKPKFVYIASQKKLDYK